MGHLLEFLGSFGSSFLVLLMSYQLQMLWIPAKTIIAQMVELFFTGNIPMIMGKSDDVRADGLTIKRHPTITPTSPVT